MMRWPGICLLTLLVSMRAMAIDAVVSHTIFYSADNSGKLTPGVDLYWQINPNTLHYITNAEKKIIGHVKTDILFTGASGIVEQDSYIMQTVPRNNLNELTQYSIIELKHYKLPAGKINLRLVLTDMNDTTNRFVYSDSFEVADPGASAFYSEIEILDTTFSSDAKTSFLKNGKQQIPVCSNFIGDGVNKLVYYTEAYNTNKIAPDDFPLIRKVAISKNESQGRYANFEKTDTIKTGGTMWPATGEFRIASLPSGNYYIRTTLENKKREIIASRSLFFQRMNKHPVTDTAFSKPLAAIDTGFEKVTVLNLKKTFLAKYSLAQVRAILKMLLPFSDQQGEKTIQGFLKKPDEMYMRYYIYNYFADINKKDPDKAWKEFSEKITEVNKLFNTHSVPGYETERGYIYLRYGPPTEMVTVENEQGPLPYEVWLYNSLRQLNDRDVPNAVFLFYKPYQMTSDFKLLHSNVGGEINNPQWRATLYNLRNNNTWDYSGTRAEQLMGNR